MDGIEKEIFPEEATREQFIVDQFERVKLDIRAYPKLFDRFKRLHGSESRHFEDAAQMAEIIDAIWPELEAELPFKLDKEKLLQTTLLHDVGKSGPEEATEEEQDLVVSFFNPSHYRKIVESGADIKKTPVIDALRGSDLDLSVQIKIANALKKWGINYETEKMIDLWQRHADWTFDILAPAQDQKITRELAVAAASHHILDGKNPAGINPEEIPGEAKTLEIVESYEVITLVDKFQAFVKRSGLTHNEAVAVLRGIIDKQSLPDKVKDDYRKILGIIDRSGEKLQTVLKPRQ
jgi:HD-GYP domain-containing protein (c-di-GMP phosphodiesterase class II)